jgi:prepilin-type N-terminal cleavage/methylation domain-containing protein
MRRFNVTNPELGFTLLEVLIVVVIAGILSAMSAPSFIGMRQRAAVNDNMNTLRSALEEVQRQAIMKSQTCTVTLDATGTVKPTITSACFVTGTRVLADAKITHNYGSANPTNEIKFDFKGNNTTVNASAVKFDGSIVLEHENNSSIKRCALISQSLGLIRLGEYDTTTTTCKAIQN